MTAQNITALVLGLSLFINLILFFSSLFRVWKAKTTERTILFFVFLGFLLLQVVVAFYGVIQKDYLLASCFFLSIISSLFLLVFLYLYSKTVGNYSTVVSDREALEQLPGFVYWKNKEGTYLGCNTKNIKDFGLPVAHTCVGKNDYDLFPKEQADAITAADREVIRKNKLCIVEEEVTLQDGSEAILLSHKMPLKNCYGIVIGIIGISLNIVSAKQEEIERLDLLEKIIALLPGHIYWVDRAGRYQGCNNQQAVSAGFKNRKEIIGKRNKDLPWNYNSGVLPETLDDINQRVMESGIPQIIEEPAILQDGAKAIFLSSKAPLRNRKGHVVGLVGVSIDITEIKNTEKALKKAKEEAEIANNAKDQFIQNIEHDLRTPSSGIAQMVHLLKEKEEDPQRKEVLAHISKAANQLLEFINSILEFDEVSHMGMPLLLKKIDIRELVQNIVDVEYPAAKSKKIDLLFECDPAVPVILINDKARLYRVLLNLVSNAVKFTSKGFVKIKLAVAKKVDRKRLLLKIVIQDTGIGIAQDKQNIIYERFIRCTSANEGHYPGSGLGLSIVKQFVDELGGEIEMHSDIGKGTTFSCILPCELPLMDSYPSMQTDASSDLCLEEEKLLSDLNILLVEDDVLAQKVASTLLSNHCQCSVDVVDTGNKALHAVQTKKYDLVFMDLGLPDIPGGEVTKKIRELGYEDLPIIALTAHNVHTSQQLTVSAKLNDFLTKPLKLEQIRAILQKWCLNKSTNTKQ